MVQNFIRFLLPFVLTFSVSVCTRSWPDDYTPTGTPVDTSGISDCGEIPAALKQILLQNGYSETAAAGIMGNIKGESSYSLYAMEEGSPITDPSWRAYENGHKTFSGGFGLVQWTSAGRVHNLQDYADSIGKPVISIEAQGGFLIQELQSYNMSPARLNSMTLEEVTWLILRDYETPNSVFCTQSNPCPDGTYNLQSARYTSVTELVSNNSQHRVAYSSYMRRYGFAVSAQSVGTESCGSTSSDDDSGQDTTAAGDGAYGASSANGYYLQRNYPNTIWRQVNNGSGWSIKASGCSLIAIANAMKYLNKTPNNPTTIAEYARTVVCGDTCTGWGSSRMSIDLLSSHYNLRLDTLWSSESTNINTKIQKVRQSLANGKPVLLRGAHASSVDCSNSANVSSGKCVFSGGGHFITIIGITADNKVIVANPANGSAGAYPASNALLYANKAASVR